MPPSDADEKSSAHAYRLLVTRREAVVVGWFQVPAESVSAGRPEHEVSGYFTSRGICSPSILPEMDPFGSDAQHELSLLG